MGKASEKLARDKAREAKKTKAMSLPRYNHLSSFVLELLTRSIIMQEDTEGERRVWDNRSCKQGLEKEQPSVKEPHQERLNRESGG